MKEVTELEKQTHRRKLSSQQANDAITRLTVAGYKSIVEEQSIDIRPLTVLAGANSSGKSSIMQPLLLLKQTLEATYDPGALLLNGPNVTVTSADQILSRPPKGKPLDSFHVGIGTSSNTTVDIHFKKQPNKGFEIREMTFSSGKRTAAVRMDMTQDGFTSILPELPEQLRLLAQVAQTLMSEDKPTYREGVVTRNRCFLELEMRVKDGKGKTLFTHGTSPASSVEPRIRELIHLPALRGNPARSYPVTAVGSAFPGTFENYAASVITQWLAEENQTKLEGLNKGLELLGLTWKVIARPINDTQVELEVGRLPRAARGGAQDLTSIADVGFGVSQTLPVVVALLAAEPGQLVYIEQPEIHLHPRAQSMMAQLLVDAANRGIRVVVETHSSLLLLGVQARVAEGRLSPQKVVLHWFTRRGDGTTEVTSADLDEAGAFGDWPEDFDDVALEAESRYLDAAELRRKTG